MNHIENEQEPNSIRSIMKESARITRGNVLSMYEVDADDFDCLVMPGGFGVAQLYCDFQLNGETM